MRAAGDPASARAGAPVGSVPKIGRQAKADMLARLCAPGDSRRGGDSRTHRSARPAAAPAVAPRRQKQQQQPGAAGGRADGCSAPRGPAAQDASGLSVHLLDSRVDLPGGAAPPGVAPLAPAEASGLKGPPRARSPAAAAQRTGAQPSPRPGKRPASPGVARAPGGKRGGDERRPQSPAARQPGGAERRPSGPATRQTPASARAAPAAPRSPRAAVGSKAPRSPHAAAAAAGGGRRGGHTSPSPIARPTAPPRSPRVLAPRSPLAGGLGLPRSPRAGGRRASADRAQMMQIRQQQQQQQQQRPKSPRADGRRPSTSGRHADPRAEPPAPPPHATSRTPPPPAPAPAPGEPAPPAAAAAAPDAAPAVRGGASPHSPGPGPRSPPRSPAAEPLSRSPSSTQRRLRPSDVAPQRVQQLTTTRCSRFLIEGQLGKGNYGVVHAGVDTQSGERVAVKVVPAGPLLSAQRGRKVDTLLREVGIQALLSHPNVVCLRALALNLPQKALWLVLDLVDGNTLEQHMHAHPGGRLDPDDARDCFQQIVVGAAYLHHCNVAHRDLKPENVLRSRAGNLKIADFGLANVQALEEEDDQERLSKALLHTFCGTPYYIAPEVHTCGTRGYDGFRADVWSLGIMLFEMFAGDVPFKARDLAHLARTVVYDPLVMSPLVAEPARPVVAALLCKDPAERPTAVEVARHPWVAPGLDEGLLDFGGQGDCDAAAEEVLRLTKESFLSEDLPGSDVE